LHILRPHNVESNIVADRPGLGAWLTRPILRLEAARLRACERELVCSLDRVLAITPEDALAYQDGVPSEGPRVRYAPVPAPLVHPAVTVPWPERRNVLFVGHCAWGPNADAARWITRCLAPVLREACPDLQLRLIGKGTEHFLRGRTDNVKCCGFVEDLERELDSALCTIAPVRMGGGVNIKVLESLAHGLPVVGTRFSRRGVESDGYLEAETAVEFCARIRELRRPGRAADLSARARASTMRACDLFEAELDEALGATRDLEALP
jgi:glycosyltransferase involved in cell wall biosynthesis